MFLVCNINLSILIIGCTCMSQETIYRRQELEKWKHDRDEISNTITVNNRAGLNYDNTVTQQVIDLQEVKYTYLNTYLEHITCINLTCRQCYSF